MLEPSKPIYHLTFLWAVIEEIKKLPHFYTQAQGKDTQKLRNFQLFPKNNMLKYSVCSVIYFCGSL